MAGLRAYLKRDGILLAVSLLLAVLVWKYVSDELTETQTVQAKLELVEPPGLTVVGRKPASVKVVLRGTRRALGAVEPGAVRASVKLPTESGRVSLNLADKDFVLPEGVEIAELPDRIELQIERLEQKTVPVRVITAGLPPAGFVVSPPPKAEPAEVSIAGPKETIDPITQLKTEAVDLTGKIAYFTAYVPLQAPDGVFCPERVLVIINIGPEPVSLDVPGVEVKVLGPAGFGLKVQVEANPVTLKLRGDGRVLSALRLDPKPILAMADVSGLARETEVGKRFHVPLILKLPSGVALASEEPPRVWVQLGKRTGE